jgi:hypothetical protein
MRQRFNVFLNDKDDIAATTAVSPVRATFGNVFLTSKGDRTGTTVPGADDYLRFIDKQKLLRGLFYRNGIY